RLKRAELPKIYEGARGRTSEALECACGERLALLDLLPRIVRAAEAYAYELTSLEDVERADLVVADPVSLFAYAAHARGRKTLLFARLAAFTLALALLALAAEVLLPELTWAFAARVAVASSEREADGVREALRFVEALRDVERAARRV